MDEQRLWAPWRMGYIAGDSPPQAAVEPATWSAGADHDCFMCRAAASYADEAAAVRANLVVAADEHVVTILNRYPYNNGHLLVCPRRHVGDLSELTADEHLAAMQAAAHFTELLRRLIRAEGFNIGLNLGRAAGAGLPGHLHWHIVPRWTGDSNFMPVTGDARVISQSLDALWEALAT
jgi:ATP adenylyltransferase